MTRDETTPIQNPRLHRGELSLDERLDRIEVKIDGMLESMGSHPIRLRALEIVVYGGCGICLIALIGAVIALVLKEHT